MTAALFQKDAFRNYTSAKSQITMNHLHLNMFGGTRSSIADTGCECMQSSKSFADFLKKITTSRRWS
jgi:hypothetical protein